MTKTRPKRKAPVKLPDEVTAAAMLEKMRLKRLITAKRDIARLVRELRRASLQANIRLEDFALGVVRSSGWKLVRREEAAPAVLDPDAEVV